MATATRKTTSFDVKCPHCMGEDSTVQVDLNDLGRCECRGCGEEFTVAEAVEMAAETLARWRKVAAWVELAQQVMEG